MTQVLTEAELVAAGKRGLIPGPKETDEQFYKRCERFRYPAPCGLAPWMQQALGRVEGVYHIRPDWVEVSFSNEGLWPWHGGGTFLWQDEENNWHLEVQLRQVFSKKERSWWGYSRTELLAHELVHAGRMAFEEARFEEMLAYRVSRWSLRRFLGPLIKKRWESMLLVGVLLVIVGADAISFLTRSSAWLYAATVLRWTPFLLIGIAAVRQWKDGRAFERARTRLVAFGIGQDHVDAILYRLTDEEICCLLPQMKTLANWQEFILQKSKESLRWRQIFLSHIK